MITGAYGYIGSRIRARLDQTGWDTTALSRNPRQGDRAQQWSLGEELGQSAAEGADVLVHCAYDLTLRQVTDIWRVNVEGSARLLTSAANAGVPRLMLISSMSAYEGTGQLYGRAKLAIEKETLALGGIAVRPGLVYGPQPGGMAGTLLRLTRLPITPVLTGAAKQYTVHEDDLAAVIVQVLGADTWTSEVFGVAQPTAVAFRQLLQGLASREDRICRMVPVPWRAAYFAVRMAEVMRLPIGLRSDSFAGLIRPAPMVPISGAFPRIQDSLIPFNEYVERISLRADPS